MIVMKIVGDGRYGGGVQVFVYYVLVCIQGMKEGFRNQDKGEEKKWYMYFDVTLGSVIISVINNNTVILLLI